ncbi:MAG: hypothetical protein ACSLFQ_06525 [Thermoanaerobaculia bacterium]
MDREADDGSGAEQSEAVRDGAADTSALGAQPQLNGLSKFVDTILDSPGLSRYVAACLRWTPGLGRQSPDSAQREWEGLVARVEGRFERRPDYATLVAFLGDHSKLTDDELVKLFSFIYYSLINNFKAELGELFARFPLERFLRVARAARPAVAVEVALGYHLRARQQRMGPGWYKGADALFVAQSNDWIDIVGVAEIKSMRSSPTAMRSQTLGHLRRLRGGLSFRAGDVPPSRIRVVTTDGRAVPINLADEVEMKGVATVLIRPRSARTRRGLHAREAAVWEVCLDVSQDTLTEAAYRFALWYFGRVGPKVFFFPREAVTADTRRRPAPFPEDSLEENGKNAFLAAMYGAGLRKVFAYGPSRPRGGRQSSGETFWRIYNALGFGVESAIGSDMLPLHFEPDETRRRRWERRKKAWDAYVDARFEDAARLLPDPADEPDVWARRREYLLLARAWARAGQCRPAHGALRLLRQEPQSTNLALPVEVGAVESLLLLVEDRESASALVAATVALLDGLRNEVALHAANNWAFPADIHVRSAQAAVLDLAVCLTALGRPSEAVELLRRLRDLQGWEEGFVARDPLLNALSGGDWGADLRRPVVNLARF